VKNFLVDLFPGLNAREVLQDILGVTNFAAENGVEIIHSCPLPFGMHKNGDANPSASLNSSSLLFNCFTCGGGSIIWLVQNCLDISRDDAIAVLKNEVKALKAVPVEKFIERLEKLFEVEKSSAIEVPHYSETLLARWEGSSDYLLDRGVSLGVQREMRTGVETGRSEVSKTPAGEGIVAVDRVVLPHFMRGRLVGWVARKITEVPGVPKYRNSKGFPRGHWLYNLDNVLTCPEIYVVESPMSVLVLKSRGIDNVVATFGAKVMDSQIELLRNFRTVTVFMDGDAPGWKASSHLVSSLSDFTRVRVIDTPDGEDPASLTEIPGTLSAFEWELINV